MSNVPPVLLTPIIPTVDNQHVAIAPLPPTEITSLPINTIIELLVVEQGELPHNAKVVLIDNLGKPITEQPFEIKIHTPININEKLSLTITSFNKNGSAVFQINNQNNLNPLNQLNQNSTLEQQNIKPTEMPVTFSHGTPLNATIINPSNLSNLLSNTPNLQSLNQALENTSNVGNFFLNAPNSQNILPQGTTLVLRITNIVTQTNNTEQQNQKTFFQPTSPNQNEIKTQTQYQGSPTTNIESTTKTNQVIEKNDSLTSSPPTVKHETGININIGTKLNGVVISSPTPNQTVVATNIGLMSIEIKSTLVPKTKIDLEVVEIKNIPFVERSESPLLVQLSSIESDNWKEIEQTLNTLKKEDTIAASQFIARLPQPNQKMIANLINYMEAIKTGDTSKFLNEETIRTLAQTSSGRDILSLTTREINKASKKIDKKPDEWKSFNMPVFVQGEGIKKISAIVRRQYEDDDSSNPKKGKAPLGKRFVVTLTLSKLGEMQLDGLAQPQNRQLDLVIKNKKPLPNEVGVGVSTIFRETLETLNYAGTISFMITNEFLNPLDDESIALKASSVVI